MRTAPPSETFGFDPKDYVKGYAKDYLNDYANDLRAIQSWMRETAIAAFSLCWM